MDLLEASLTIPPPDLSADDRRLLLTLQSRVFLSTPNYFTQQHRADRRGAHADILEFERRFIRRFASLDIPMFAHNMVRTKSEQDRLYVQGVTKARGGLSPHNHGCAVDLVHCLRAWDLPRPAWALIGHIGKEVAHQQGVRLTWGGDWKFYDPAHWELANWKELKDGFPYATAEIFDRASFDDFYREPE